MDGMKKYVKYLLIFIVGGLFSFLVEVAILGFGFGQIVAICYFGTLVLYAIDHRKK